MNGKEILTYLSLKYKGDWDKIYQAVYKKEPIKEEVMMNELKTIKANVVTIIDNDYPSWLKEVNKPPFALYYYGDLSLIKDPSKNIAITGTQK